MLLESSLHVLSVQKHNGLSFQDVFMTGWFPPGVRGKLWARKSWCIVKALIFHVHTALHNFQSPFCTFSHFTLPNTWGEAGNMFFLCSSDKNPTARQRVPHQEGSMAKTNSWGHHLPTIPLTSRHETPRAQWGSRLKDPYLLFHVTDEDLAGPTWPVCPGAQRVTNWPRLQLLVHHAFLGLSFMQLPWEQQGISKEPFVSLWLGINTKSGNHLCPFPMFPSRS
jgi:hypothetical protein